MSTDLLAVMAAHDVPILVGFLGIMLPVSWRFALPNRRRPAMIALLLGVVHVLLLGMAGQDPSRPVPGELRFVTELAAIGAMIVGGAHLLFDAVLARWGILKPVIIRDLSILALFGLAGILGASRAGFALSGVIATSAVLTAVIGLSLQDTLGNIIGGISLQLDSSLAVGDWIKVGEQKGRVVQIGWRCTTIETNDWETILLPNSVLMRGSVVILARRSGAASQWRRWVRFHTALNIPPARVIQVVEAALGEVAVPHLAVQPKPSCICIGVEDGCASYAVRYWLVDPLHDDSTDSRVRSVVIASLAREGILLTTPAQGFIRQAAAEAVFHAEESRLELIAGVGLFAALTRDEKEAVAAWCSDWPVATGEHLITAGEPGDSLFIVASGKFSVELSGTENLTIGVARLGRGTVIGEMSLLTGEPRAATVIALTDSLCYRLDRSDFKKLTDQRPDLLLQLSLLLAQRQEGNSSAQRQLHILAEQREGPGHGSRLFQRMRDWLGSGESQAGEGPSRIELPTTTLEDMRPDFDRR